MKPFHQRLAELWTLNKRRPLTPEEMTEVQHCLSLNTKYVWEMAYLENMSLIASMTNDVDWQHEICIEIDRIEFGEKKKKPGRKSTD
ncbi:DUF7667 family protein [Ferviditalea candida]|uniref:Uncharacterized protein n=1 Tax=Ferviditalea candida TaxID=3108399 RepID=A0ABU5ZP35_9BACL|nr:hypothetical protein [Paenibacillaceae bacterium T2]